MNEGLNIAHDAVAYSRTFDIAFDTVTAAGTPFTASLIAIGEALKTPPTLEFADFQMTEDYSEFISVSISPVEHIADWEENITGVFYSTNEGETYTELNLGSDIQIDYVDGIMTYPFY